MNKKKILSALLENAKQELQLALEAQASASRFKHESDMKQESKYDTRGIEAGYLSDAQSKRVEELKLELKLIEEIPCYNFKEGDEISLGALIEIEVNQRKKLYFLSSTAGGTMLNIEDIIILVISAFSPLGSSVINLKTGDTFELETNAGTREYKICSVQ